MKPLITIIAIIPLFVFGQSIERQAIGTTMAWGTASSIQLSYTAGEAVVETGSAGTIILTQGFQQPSSGTGGVGIDDLQSGLSIEAYPNPTNGDVIIEFNVNEAMNLEVGLYDLLGKKAVISAKNLAVHDNLKHRMNLSGIANGTYLLSFKNSDGILGTIKVIKTGE